MERLLLNLLVSDSATIQEVRAFSIFIILPLSNRSLFEGALRTRVLVPFH